MWGQWAILQKFIHTVYTRIQQTAGSNNLNNSRFQCFNELVNQANSAMILSCFYHHWCSMPPPHRVRLQIQMWLENSLDLRIWGWKQQNPLLSPVYMTKALASGTILTLISCDCTQGCERKCKCVEADVCCTAIYREQNCTNRVLIDLHVEFSYDPL